MTTSSDDAGSEKAGTEICTGCGAALVASRRYCLECGARIGPLPAVVANRVGALKERGRADKAVANGTPLAPADPCSEGLDGEARQKGPWSFMPSPQVAAVAVMALLAAGVVLGSVTNPLARGAGAASIILELGESESPQDEVEEPVAEAPGYTPETPAFAPVEAPLAAPLEAPAPEPGPASAPELPPELPEEELLPEIKHVFLIVLTGHGYEEAFGTDSAAPYLAETLAGEGKLLSNYYAVAQGGLANEIALISGQGPTPQIAINCPQYTSISPGTVNAEGQVEGDGCVFPPETETLPSQLAEAELTWKAYVEDIAGGAAAGQPTTCRHPAPGSPDTNLAPIAGDPYLTWRNPFVYFAGLTEGAECGENDVGLDRLTADLKAPEETPSVSYIVANACHDGSEAPCAPDQPAGLAGADGFLETVVPEITASPAFKDEGGLIAVTFDQAARGGPESDTGSCCVTPEYPNLPAPAESAGTEPPATGPVKPTGGGGRVGMLLISPYLTPGTVEEAAYFNHFSFLRSVEELFGLEPLGYAAEPALTGFEPSLFDASPEESTVRPAPPR